MQRDIRMERKSVSPIELAYLKLWTQVTITFAEEAHEAEISWILQSVQNREDCQESPALFLQGGEDAGLIRKLKAQLELVEQASYCTIFIACKTPWHTALMSLLEELVPPIESFLLFWAQKTAVAESCCSLRILAAKQSIGTSETCTLLNDHVWLLVPIVFDILQKLRISCNRAALKAARLVMHVTIKWKIALKCLSLLILKGHQTFGSHAKLWQTVASRDSAEGIHLPYSFCIIWCHSCSAVKQFLLSELVNDWKLLSCSDWLVLDLKTTISCTIWSVFMVKCIYVCNIFQSRPEQNAFAAFGGACVLFCKNVGAARWQWGAADRG